MAEVAREEGSCSIKVNLAYHNGIPGIPFEAFRDHVIPRLLSAMVLHEIRKELAHAR